MTDDAKPILAYATPSHVADDTSVFEFRSPPVALELSVKLLGAIVFAAAAVAVIVQFRKLPAATRDWTAMIFPGVAAAACAVFAVQAWRRSRHLMRFGGLPVKITIADDQLILTDPPQWGLKVRAVPLERVERCYSEFGGWTLTGPKIYRINLFVREREALELRVATRDSAVVDRAIAAISARLLPSPPAGE